MSLRRASAMVAAGVLIGGLVTSPAAARESAACSMWVGSVTADGNLDTTVVRAASPPTSERKAGPHLFTPGSARISSTWTLALLNPVGSNTYGYTVLNTSLYAAQYGTGTDGQPTKGMTRIGGGWGPFTAVEESFYWGSTTQRSYRYGLRNDGVLFRWGSDWRRLGSYPGFSAVKAMALISETATYDTFLATTRGGALYTIRIPVTSPMKPVVKLVRRSTWQGFEWLVAEKCGRQSTLLTGIDKDTGSAYLYAVGHANGLSTVIQGLGKIQGTFTDPVYYLKTAEGNEPLYGE